VWHAPEAEKVREILQLANSNILCKCTEQEDNPRSQSYWIFREYDFTFCGLDLLMESWALLLSVEITVVWRHVSITSHQLNRRSK